MSDLTALPPISQAHSHFACLMSPQGVTVIPSTDFGAEFLFELTGETGIVTLTYNAAAVILGEFNQEEN